MGGKIREGSLLPNLPLLREKPTSRRQLPRSQYWPVAQMRTKTVSGAKLPYVPNATTAQLFCTAHCGRSIARQHCDTRVEPLHFVGSVSRAGLSAVQSWSGVPPFSTIHSTSRTVRRDAPDTDRHPAPQRNVGQGQYRPMRRTDDQTRCAFRASQVGCRRRQNRCSASRQ